MKAVRVLVDHRACARHGLCAAAAPGAFRLGADGRARVDPAADARAAHDAARLCPAQAIRVEDDR